MKQNNLYTQSHLVVSAIRILEYQNEQPPSVDAVCDMLSFSSEHAQFLCKKMDGMGIIEMVEGPFGSRLFIRDHLKIEDLPRNGEKEGLREEIEKFQNAQKGFQQKIENYQAQKAEARKNLFAEIEEKLKKQVKS